MDSETRRVRRLAAHTRLAQDHPVYELYVRPLARPVLVVLFVLLAGWGLVSWAGPTAGSLVSATRDRWPVAVLVLVLLIGLLMVWRRLRNPYRISRRYR